MDDMFNEGDFPGTGLYAADDSLQPNFAFLQQQSYKSRHSLQHKTQDLSQQSHPQPGDPHPSRKPPAEHPGSNKNKYIRQITKMIDEVKKQEIPADLLHHSRQHKQSLDSPEDEGDQKLNRNRISARNSRQRKKLYIDLMETKLVKLEEDKQNLLRQLHEARENLSKASTLAQQTAGGFTVGRQHTIKKLEQLVSKKQEGDPEEINIILDSLRFRISATGKERVNTVNEYFRQIVNNCFPALNRYLMWSAIEGKHIFSQDPNKQTDQWFRNLYQSLRLSPKQLQSIRGESQTLIKEKNDLDKIVSEIQEAKQQLSKRSEDADQLVDNFRNVLGPIQCARLILFIDVNKYRKEFSVWDGHNGKTSMEKLEHEAGVKTLKKVKHA